MPDLSNSRLLLKQIKLFEAALIKNDLPAMLCAGLMHPVEYQERTIFLLEQARTTGEREHEAEIRIEELLHSEQAHMPDLRD